MPAGRGTVSKKVRLFHSTPAAALQHVREQGLRVVSEFPDLELPLRQGVVYCWLRPEDDKMSVGGQRPNHVYVEVEVDEDRCTVADMEWVSLAITYAKGFGNRPRNPEAARLLAQVYEVTAVPLSGYVPGMFFTPEVLVKGDIGPESVSAPMVGESE